MPDLPVPAGILEQNRKARDARVPTEQRANYGRSGQSYCVGAVSKTDVKL
jgi:hypothetical protein